MSDVYTPNVRSWILDGENWRDGDGRMVACFCYPSTSSEGKANAAFSLEAAKVHHRLTADRDALLAACKAVAEWFGASSPEDEAVLKQVRAAIDQAERH